jgi:GT2 family glycosyltransferase
VSSGLPQPAVAVAVVSWNTRDLLAECLRSLAPEHEAGRAEVWVVDNASVDGSPELVRNEFPWVSLVASGENLGFGRAVNVVAGRTAAPWIAPANADTALTPGALETLVAAGEQRPGAGIVAPRLVLPDGATQHSVHPFPTVPVALAFNLGVHRLSRRLGERLAFTGSWDEERERVVDWAIAAFMLVRREAYEEAGGFDEAQWIYAEDLDLAWRLRRSGWVTLYEPRAAVRHSASASATQAFGEDVVSRWMAASYDWMARRRGLARMWAYGALNLAGVAVRLAAATALARARPERFVPLRDEYRRWWRAHRAALRSHR